MKTPAVNLRPWLVAVGWVLVVGGLVEAVELIFHDWSHAWWRHHGFLHAIVSGPAVEVGLGSALWALAKR